MTQVPKDMDEEQLRPLFEQAGPIAHIMVIRDRQTDAHRGEFVSVSKSTSNKNSRDERRRGVFFFFVLAVCNLQHTTSLRRGYFAFIQEGERPETVNSRFCCISTSEIGASMQREDEIYDTSTAVGPVFPLVKK